MGVWRRVLLASVFLGLVALGPLSAEARAFASGWHNPTGTAYNDWDFGSCNGDYGEGIAHLGTDSQGAPTGGAVVAVGSGRVVSSTVWSGWPGQVFGIEHVTGGGERFVGVYGHINPDSGMGVGKTVTAGQRIGSIAVWNGDHLHFGVRPLSAGENAAAVPLKGMSGCSGDGSVDLFGYVNPIPWLTARPPGSTPPPTEDRAFIRTPDGRIYRIVGGAPVHVQSCAPLSGCPGVVQVPNLAGYPSTPRNGAYMRKANGPGAGLIARIAGGHPIGLGTCAPLDGCDKAVDLDSGGFTAYAKAHPTVANETFVRVANGGKNGLISRAAGGHLIGLATCAPAELRGCAGHVNVDEHGYNAYMKAHPTVANKTFVRVTNGAKRGLISRAAGGHLIGLATCASAELGGCAGHVNVDEAGYNAYAKAHPNVANGTFVRVANGSRHGLITRAAGGHLFGLTSCEPLGGCAGHINVDDAGFRTYASAHPHAADGTVLRALPSDRFWRIQGGHRTEAGRHPSAVSVNDATVGAVPLSTCPAGFSGVPPACAPQQQGAPDAPSAALPGGQAPAATAPTSNRRCRFLQKKVRRGRAVTLKCHRRIGKVSLRFVSSKRGRKTVKMVKRAKRGRLKVSTRRLPRGKYTAIAKWGKREVARTRLNVR